MPEDLKNFPCPIFQISNVRMSKVALMGLVKYQNEQSHEIWCTYPDSTVAANGFTVGAIMTHPPVKIVIKNKTSIV